MAGHSHFRTIRHKKELEDKKRSKIFSKISRLISVAAREGADPETNPKLKRALEQAKKVNMPKENIERAIKRGCGELEGENLEEISIEGLIPGGILLILEGITDNKNRTLTEIKQILQKYNGKIADPGAVKWLFEKKGCVTLNKNEQPPQLQDKETMELKAIEAGAQDLEWENEDILEVFTQPEELDTLGKNLKNQGFKIESSYLDWVPKQKINLTEEQATNFKKILEELDENDAIQEIFSNVTL